MDVVNFRGSIKREDVMNDTFMGDFDLASYNFADLRIAAAVSLGKPISDEILDEAHMNATSIDPELYRQLDSFVLDRASANEETNLLRCSAHSQANHTELLALIQKTWAFPITSHQTLGLAAVCAFLAADDAQLALRYFKALVLHASRRYDLDVRRDYVNFQKTISQMPQNNPSHTVENHIQRFNAAAEKISLAAECMDHNDFQGAVARWMKCISARTEGVIGGRPIPRCLASLRRYLCLSMMTLDEQDVLVSDIQSLAGIFVFEEAAPDEQDDHQGAEHNTETHIRIAKETTLLWVFFRYCLIAARHSAMHASVEPSQYIRGRQLQCPLFVVSDHEYSTRLGKCTTPFQMARCLVVYGNPEREAECNQLFHAFYGRRNKSMYREEETQAVFERYKSMQFFSLETDEYHKGFRLELDHLARKNGESLILPLNPHEIYSSKFVLPFPTDKPIVAVKSACGTGKSVQMLKYVDQIDEDVAIVCITHRKALSAEIQKRMRQTKRGDFALYSDIEGWIDLSQHPNLICEYESLSRIPSYKGRVCVIIDEVNSVLHQTQSAAGDSQAAHMVFSGLMAHAHRVLLMDAFLDQHRMNVIANYVSAEPHVVVNTFQPNAGHIVYHTANKNKAKQKLLLLIEQGENIIVPCVLKKDAEEVYHLACSVLDPTDVQLYTADSRWKNGDDVNSVWCKARVVIHTSTMDSGHSFELDHFGWAVCFFSNTVSIPVEACLQMKARSRNTTRFVVCVEQRSVATKEMSIRSVIKRIHEHQKQMANSNCERFFGTKAYWGAYGSDEYPSCPFLELYATTQMLLYQSRKHYSRLLFEMITNDGVEEQNITELEEERVSDFKGIVERARKEAKSSAKIPSSFALAGIYTHTPMEVFDRMDDELKRFYQELVIVQAYHNRLALHAEGVDFADALKNMQAKQERIKTALAVCRSTGKFDESSLLSTEVQLGLHIEDKCAASFVECNLIACALLEIFTGKRNPFEINSIHGSVFQHCTKCVLQSTSKSKYAVYEINTEISVEIKRLYERYVMRSGSARYTGPKNRPMTLTEGLNQMNELLKRQFGLKLQRTSSKTASKKGEKRENFYEMQDIFVVSNNDLKRIHALKPVLPCWSVSIAQITDEEILSCKLQNGYSIVCLGIAFDSWPCSDSEHKHQYDSMKKQCLGNTRELKKRQIQNDIETDKLDWSKLPETEKQQRKQLEVSLDEDRNRRYEISRTQSMHEKAKKQKAKRAMKKRHRHNSEQALAKKKSTFIGYHPMGFFGNLSIN